MPLPANWNIVTVPETYLKPDGSPATGSVQFIAQRAVGMDDTVVLPHPITAPMNGSGTISASLPCPDDAGAGFTSMIYLVRERTQYGREDFYIEINNTMTVIALEHIPRVDTVPPQDWYATLEGIAAEAAASAAIVELYGPEMLDRLEVLEAGQTAGMLGFETKALMDADLAHLAGTLALVTNDATLANNTTYRKIGASGAGSWVMAADRLSAVVADLDVIEETFDITPPKNLYNPALAEDGFLYNFAGGDKAAFANSIVTGKVPVQEGKTYTFSQPAPEAGFFPGLYFYSAANAYLGMEVSRGGSPVVAGVGLVASDPGGTGGQRIVTFTVPVGSGAAYVAALLLYNYAAHSGSDFNRIRNAVQLEEGNVATAFEAYGSPATAMAKEESIPDTIQRTTQPTLVERIGNSVYIRTPFDATYDLVQRIELVNGNNSTVNVQGARKILKTTRGAVAGWNAGTALAAQGDSSAPLNYNGTFIGANHGAAVVREVTAAAHGKAVQDVGSNWTDGAAITWTLIKIVDANKLWFMRDFNGAYPAWTVPSTTLTGNLTHASGATNTAGVTVGSSVLTQLWPSLRNQTYAVLLDGATEVTADGAYRCTFVDVVNAYDIVNPAAVLAYVRSQVGGGTQPSFIHSSIAADVHRTLTYRYAENGNCTIIDGVRVLATLSWTGGYFPATQAEPLTYTGKQLWQYIPRVTPKVGGIKTWDFAAQEQIDGSMEQVNLTSANWTDANNPPDRMAQIVKTAGVAEFGMMIGVSPARGLGAPAVRKTLLTDALFVSAIRKQYVKSVGTSAAITAGSYYETVGFRAYWSASANAQATTFVWFRDGKDIIAIADFHQNVSFSALKLPGQFVGKDVTVVDKSASLTVHGNGVLTADGVLVSVTSGYGYVVLKLT